MTKLVGPNDRTKSPNQYILEIIELRKANAISIEDGRVQSLIKHIKDWAEHDFAEVFVSGSSAKGTVLKGSSDLDLFISLKSGMSDRLEDNFHSLAEMLSDKDISFRRQNVSVRVKYHGLQIDLVPGKKKPRSRHKHTLYMHRDEMQNRIETNVNNHIKYVVDSGRVNEILALKIWRDINEIGFPSMYLEMYTIMALKGKWKSKKFLARNFYYVLEHLANYFDSAMVYDPSNGSNKISDSLYAYEKKSIQAAAQRAIKQEFLNQIIY